MNAEGKRSRAPGCVTKIPGVVLRLAGSFHGLEIGFPKIRILGLFFWSLAAATYPFTVLLYFYYTTFQTRDQVGLSDITSAFGAFNFMLSTLASIFTFIVNHKSVERLLAIDASSAVNVFVPLLCGIPFFLTCMSIISRTDEIVIFVGYVNYVTFDASMTIFFVLYMNVNSSVLGQLERLYQVTQKDNYSWNFLMREKLRIRQEIRVINSIFALPLALHYVQLFIGVIFDFAATMGHSMHPYEKSILMGSLFTYLVTLLRAAHMGSQITSKCLDTEFHLMTLAVHTTASRDTTERSEAINVLRFRGEWDALKVACFESSLENFIKYLSAMVTCVAVVLQFDYKVVRFITNLAKSHIE